MQLPNKIQSLLKPDSQNFICCSGKNYQQIFRNPHKNEAYKLFQLILNDMGLESSKAQGLKSIITTATKFIGSDQRIYIKISDKKVLGFVKVGQKNLFYRDYVGGVKQIKPTCILDIYVHKSCQRSGIGKEIFEKFLAEESRTPQKLGYDRPSQKLISFLKKHYRLHSFIPQNNNFVIFDQFFKKQRPQSELTKKSVHRQIKVQSPVDRQVKIETEQPPRQTKQPMINPKDEISGLIAKQDKNPNRQFSKQMLMQNNKIHNIKPLNYTMKGFSQGAMKTLNNHRNTNSEAFPFMINYKPAENLGFRTTSKTYGNYYKPR